MAAGRQLLEVVGAAPRGQQDQRRADALASGGEEVRHRRRDHVGVAVDETAQAGFDRLQITRDRAEDGRLRSASHP